MLAGTGLVLAGLVVVAVNDSPQASVNTAGVATQSTTAASKVVETPKEFVSGPEEFALILGDLKLLPDFQTLTELKTYGDTLVRIHITGESRLPMMDSEIKSEYGLILRRLTYSMEDIIWERPGSTKLPLKGELTPNGWIYDHGKETAFKDSVDSPWLLVGHDYYMVFTRLEWLNTGSGEMLSEWYMLARDGITSADGGIVGAGERLPVSGASRLQTDAAGLDRDGLAAFFERVEVDPSAQAYVNLDPAKRWG